MQALPKGWPRLSVSLAYQDANGAIDWLCRAFDLTVRIKVPDDKGGVAHSELLYGDAVIMVSSPKQLTSPTAIGGANTQACFLYVDDVDAHYARAKEAGAKATEAPKVTDYGAEYWADKGYVCFDLEGHYWAFAQRVRS